MRSWRKFFSQSHNLNPKITSKLNFHYACSNFRVLANTKSNRISCYNTIVTVHSARIDLPTTTASKWPKIIYHPPNSDK